MYLSMTTKHYLLNAIHINARQNLEVKPDDRKGYFGTVNKLHAQKQHLTSSALIMPLCHSMQKQKECKVCAKLPFFIVHLRLIFKEFGIIATLMCSVNKLTDSGASEPTVVLLEEHKCNFSSQLIKTLILQSSGVVGEKPKELKVQKLLFVIYIQHAVSFAHFPFLYTGFSSYHHWNGAVLVQECWMFDKKMDQV